MRVSYRRRRATTPATAAESTRTNGTAKSNAAAGGAEGGTSAGIVISSVAVDERVSGLLSTMLHHAARLSARAQRPIGVLVNLYGSGLSGSHPTRSGTALRRRASVPRFRASGCVCPTVAQRESGLLYFVSAVSSYELALALPRGVLPCRVAGCLATYSRNRRLEQVVARRAHRQQLVVPHAERTCLRHSGTASVYSAYSKHLCYR